MKKIFELTFSLVICFVLVYAALLSGKKVDKTKDLKQIAYSEYSIKTKPKLISVKVIVYDDTIKPYYDLEMVTFNNRNIFLSNANAEGYRGAGYFKVPPGRYELKWTITIGANSYKTFTQLVDINEVDKYVHILIEGENKTESKS